MKYEIEDIPLPTPRNKYGDIPFEEMKVGQSLFIPNVKTANISNHFTRLTGMKFTARKSQKNMYDEEQKKFVPTSGVRIWRTE